MSRTATAAQQARQRVREWATDRAAGLAQQESRVNDAIATFLAAEGKITLAAAAVADAQAAHDQIVRESTVDIDRAVAALKAEDLGLAEIAKLTGLTVADVRRSLKAASPKASPSASRDGGAVPPSPES